MLSQVRNGRPTEPDVVSIMKRWPNPQAGEVIGFDDIASVIDTKPEVNRFKSVVGAWRKRLERESNIVTKGVRGTIVILGPSQRIDFASRKMRGGIRSLTRAGNVAGSTEQKALTESECHVATHMSMISTMLRETYNREARKLEHKQALKEVQHAPTD